MKKRFKILALFCKGFEEVECEDFNELCWIYSTNWKSNEWLKKDYAVCNYALVDKRTGMHIHLSNTLKEIKEIDSITILIDYIDTYKEIYSSKVEKYNKALIEYYGNMME